MAGPTAQAQFSLQIAIGAALGSVIVTCLVTTPFEVLRIRAIEAASTDAFTAAPPDTRSSEVATPTPVGAGELLASEVAPDARGGEVAGEIDSAAVLSEHWC